MMHTPDRRSPAVTAPHTLLRSLVWLLAVAGLCPLDAPAQPRQAASAAAAQGLQYEAVDNGFVISIRVDGTLPAGVSQQGRDLFVSFATATPAFDAAELQKHAAAWVDGVSVGYDSLLLRLARGVRVHIESGGTTLRLRFEADTEPASDADGSAPAPDERPGAVRLELLRAQLLLRNQELAQARERYAALRTLMPARPEPLAGLAGVEWQAGRWRRSLALYREAAALAPDNPDLTAASLAIERSQAGRASVLVEQRKSRGGEFDAPVTVTLGEARASWRLAEAWRLNLQADVARVRTDSVRRASGALEAFSGQRSRAVLAAQHDAMDGAASAASLFLGRDAAGLGLLRRQPDDFGATQLVAEARRHNWDHVEGLVDGALRDRLALGRTQRLRADLSGRLELGLNRYHRRDEGQLGRSTSLAGELRLDALAGVPGLAAVYALDAEYIDRRATRQAASGELFAPLPLVDREVHSATLGYARSRGNRWAGSASTFDGYAGVGSDRYGRSGVIAGVTLAHARDAVELQLRASRVRNVGRSRGSTDALGVMVSILF